MAKKTIKTTGAESPQKLNPPPGIFNNPLAPRQPSPTKSVLDQIIERFNFRVRKDIGDWMRALAMAENVVFPRRILLNNLYDQLELDGFWSGIVDHSLRDKLFAEPFKVVDKDSGTEDKDASNLFKEQWFFDFMELIVQHRVRGHTLCELGDIVPGYGYTETRLVPYRNVEPYTGQILADQWDIDGLPYRGTDLMDGLIELGRAKDLGMFKKAAPHIILKKNAQIAWGEFTEIFGMPLRVGKTNARSQMEIDRMEDALRRMGKAAYAVFQDGESVEFVQAMRTDAYQVYDALIDRCNSELSILAKGETMTTQNGSSRSQAEVHERLADDVIESYKQLVVRLTNTEVIPRMIKDGFKLNGLRFVYEEEKDLDQLWDRVNDALQHYDVDADWIEDTFGIPVAVRPVPVQGNPADESTGEPDPDATDDDSKGDPGGRPPQPAPGQPAKPGKPIPAKPDAAPGKSGAGKKKKLSSLSLLNARIELLYYQHGHIHLAAKRTPQQADGDGELDSEKWEAIIERVSNEIYEGKLKPGDIDDEMVQHIADDLMAAVKLGTGLDINSNSITESDYAMLKTIRDNIFVFSGFKNYQQLKEASGLLLDDDGKLKSKADFTSDAKQLDEKYNTAWLSTEWDNAVNTSAAITKWNNISKEKSALPYLEYDTMEDDRVRPEHAAMDKIVKPVDDPFWDTYYPPNDWGCRCTVRQVADADTTPPDDTPQPVLPKMFATNPGKTGIVFPETHPYFEASKADKAKVNKQVAAINPNNK